MKVVDQYHSMSPFEFKDILLEFARKKEENSNIELLNAGRGEPNFHNTTVRDAFGVLMQFMSLHSDVLSDHANLGYCPPRNDLVEKLQKSLYEDFNGGNGAKFLLDAIQFVESQYQLCPEEFIFELGKAAMGSSYPSPPRILTVMEHIYNYYIHRILGASQPFKWFDLVATEGATMAMVYIFNSLKRNYLLNDHDKIAIITPIFSPYLEIPSIKEIQLGKVYIEANVNHSWQIPDKELEKLKDPKVKALFLVNPSNPPGISLSQESKEALATIIKNDRPDLFIITDEVYATFVNDFVSMLYDLPENTIGVYSFSKYFGVTGWRLGLIMIHENNVFDYMIQRLPNHLKEELYNRYRLVSKEPDSLSFAERIVADSRCVALMHAAGLSGPQQALMALLSIFELMDEDFTYKKTITSLLQNRVRIFEQHLNVELLSGSIFTHYYIFLDLMNLAESAYGREFAEKFIREVTVYDFLIKLAKDTATVCLPGPGFCGSEGMIRVSLANLKDYAYAQIAKNIKKVIEDYHMELSHT